MVEKTFSGNKMAKWLLVYMNWNGFLMLVQKNWFLKASGNKLDITKLVEINWEKLVKNKGSKYASVISNEGRKRTKKQAS